jgi:hypothetical protein
MTDKVKGLGRTIGATFTRPADTNAYTAGDVISSSTSAPALIDFPGATLGAGDSGVILQAILIDSANQATKPDLELWIFDTAPAAENDNGAFAPSDAEVATLIGVIPFASASFKAGNFNAGAAGNSVCDVTNLGIAFNTTNASQGHIFGILVVRNTYTPVSAEQFTIRLKVLD